MVDLEQAKTVARIFRRHPEIEAVELFGSVARRGEGSDLDLILITNEERHWIWLHHCMRLHKYKDKGLLSSSKVREIATCYSFGIGFFKTLKEAKEIIRPASLDLLVYAPDWRNTVSWRMSGGMAEDARIIA